ncbi:hypothetical protein Bca52824_016211 [Brassica carinata]|uniref:Uncharacterized protein n=1 Tax=Brassica carinata TaxID=52824 RepID=A0A8X7W373_BRACI|nr:hypothetical protein Bca52824_016211 [Brassica carinata]
MRDKSDPALDSSSIGSRSLNHAAVKGALFASETERLPPVVPLSIIRVGEITNWREKYQLSEDVVIRVSEALEISLAKLNPPSWRTLIAMQNLGDLEGRVIGVVNVLYSYSISPLNGGEGRYHLHPRIRELPVHEIPKRERKHHPVFESRWTKKFAFMGLPGFSSIWRAAGGL